MNIVNTNHFWKFLCTTSLVCLIYFASFETIFLIPHNDKVRQMKFEHANLKPEQEYYRELSKELYEQVKDYCDSHIITSMVEKSDTMTFVCYYFKRSNLDNEYKAKIDSLNKVSMLYAKTLLKIDAINSSYLLLRRNIVIRECVSYALGILSSFVFFFSLLQWYRQRWTIDK